MSGRRRLRILEALGADRGRSSETALLCAVSAEVTAMSGAGIMLMSGDATPSSICASDERSTLVEQLQFDLGEGPCVDAHHHEQPVLEPDLAAPAEPRWTAFTGAAVAAGVCAVFGFPIGIGAARLGALNLYRDEPGALTDHQHADALVMADVAAHALLALQAEAPLGDLAAELASGGDFHPVVHQASGMVAAQMSLDVGDALVRLRAHAFGSSVSLAGVARAVVDRTLRFDERGDPLVHQP